MGQEGKFVLVDVKTYYKTITLLFFKNLVLLLSKIGPKKKKKEHRVKDHEIWEQNI